MTAKSHWEQVYGQKDATFVRWYAPHLQQSLHYVRQSAPDRAAAIIDVGGGESTLVDDLVTDGYANLTVLDISAAALDATQRRLGERGQRVIWKAADVLHAELPAAA